MDEAFVARGNHIGRHMGGNACMLSLGSS
jgi:hypothetical protein